MFHNDRKTIGVFAESLSSEDQHKVCNGIIREARAKGYNVALFSSHGSYGQSERFCTGDMQIYQLPPYEELSGAVLILDTMDQKENAQKVIETVKNRCCCPIVSIRMAIPGVNTILVNNKTCMEGVIRHVIDHHKAKRICFMTGPKNHFDAIDRLNGFLSLMNEYHLPVEDYQILYGDFWKHMGPAACDQFLNGHEKPDAILCANDHMAIAVTSELLQRGYRVPEDIIVCGYDGLDYAFSFSPSITTAEAPMEEMGRKSIQLIDDQQEDHSQPETIFLRSELCIRESCGCKKMHDLQLITARRNEFKNLQDKSQMSVVFSYLSTQLAEHSSMEEVSDILCAYLHHFSHLDSYALCLNQDMSSDHRLVDYTKSLVARVAYKNGQPISRVNLPFQKSDLLPKELTDSKPQAWFFIPIHFLDHCLGYEAFQFEESYPAGVTYFQFDVIVCNKVYETLTYAKMQSMIQELQVSSMHDSLTGLYNRSAFTKYGSQTFLAAKDAQKPVFVAVMDMDNLKLINDFYGHLEGDFALKHIAADITKCCNDQFIFARTGGDEYYFIAKDMDEEAGLSCLAAVERELDAFNALAKKPYSLHASYGHYYDVPIEGETLDDFIKVADRFMYHNKIDNKRRRGESLR